MPKNAKLSCKRKLAAMDLVATTAHELKSPLVFMRGLSAMLRDQQFGSLNVEQTKYIDKINATSDRLLQLVANLLTVNQVANRAVKAEANPVGVNKVIRQVLAELAPQLTAKQMTVLWTDHTKLPPVIGDEQMLYQIFYNLVDNTIKYSPAKTTLTIKFRTGLKHLAVQLRDQGLGLKKQELGLLFERFGSISQPINSQAGSSGLGLFIVKSLVELQGGKVTANRLRRGSCFTVSLPTMLQLELFS